MRLMSLRIILLFSVFSLIAASGFSQINSFCRGHSNGDMYLYCRPKQGSSELQLYYITQYGAVIRKQQGINNTCTKLVADNTEGKLIGFNSDSMLVSYDYGNTFSKLAAYPKPPTHTVEPKFLYGGSNPGEYFTICNDLSVSTENKAIVYYTTDDFHKTYVAADSMQMPYCGDVGIDPGELYLRSNNTLANYLYHSFDYGMAFDTVQADGVNNISRGIDLGEIFWVSFAEYPSGGYECFINRSTDFGNTWDRYEPHLLFGTTPSVSNMFTSGRTACSFYIAEVAPSMNSEYNMLNIYVSYNCGLSFLYYSYELNPFVGMDEQSMGNHGLIISPNPASQDYTVQFTIEQVGKTSLKLYSAEGKLVTTLFDGQQNTGEHKFDYRCANLNAGYYTVVLIQENGVKKIGKLIVTR